MSELTNIHARAVKDLTTPTELPVDPDALDQVKLVAGNFPSEYSGNEAVTLKFVQELAAQGRDEEIAEVNQKITDLDNKTAEADLLLNTNKADKEYVDNELNLKAPQSSTYTKTEVDNALATKAPQATTYTKVEVDTKFSAYVGGRKAYTTLALAQAAQSSLPANTAVEVTNDPTPSNNGTYQWNGTTLTKSAYDPLTQAKADATTKANTAKSEAISAAAADATAKANTAESNANIYTDTEIAERIEQVNNSQYAAVFEDVNGNIAIGIEKDGSVDIPKLKQGGSSNGETQYKTLSIGNDDSIMHFGDSLSAGTYNVQHKAYVCQLSQVSPFRHINYSDSGKMLINFHNFLLSDTLLFNATVKQHNPKYAIIATLVNDYVYSNADIKYTQENLRRLVDNLLALGTTPVIFVEFVTTSEQHQAYKAVADEYKIPFISALELNKKIGGYAWTAELFHQPHVGMRTSHLFTLPMLDWIEQQLPLRTIKIYRKRTTFTASTDVDLLYKDVIDKSKKWQEIGIAHNYLRNPQYYDEIGETAGANLLGFQSLDDYVKIQNNQNVAFTDYCLIEIGLDAFARDVEEIKINLGLSSTPLAYVRNNLDPSVALAAGAWNSTDYQSKYALPRGAWKSVSIVGGVITINKADVIYSMVGNKVQLMLKGAFNLSSLRVDYIASKYQNSQPVIAPIKRQLSTELLTQTLTDATSLAGWTKVGTVNALVPIDRKPLKNNGTAITGICTLTASNSIAQAVTLVASEELRTFKVTVLARYFPKAWVDLTNAVYTALDSNQTLDRNSQPAPITTSSFDVKELRLESWVGTSIPTATGGTAKHIKPVFMLWKPVEFFVDVEPFATQLNIRLSAVEGEVQVAKVSVKEVL